jgi:hypothetical protein
MPSPARGEGTNTRTVLAAIRARRQSFENYDAANFTSLMASKSCTPPPTRLVV